MTNISFFPLNTEIVCDKRYCLDQPLLVYSDLLLFVCNIKYSFLLKLKLYTLLLRTYIIAKNVFSSAVIFLIKLPRDKAVDQMEFCIGDKIIKNLRVSKHQ